MRYLNKIVFINSAHVPYSEISLDGNVHFIGTQGTGKSTLLRALLFFYNADKLKLGISKEKSTFDSYYFAYDNSYIIYEVMRENGPYCVMAFRNQGRVMFRFIDTAYDKGFFINENGEALCDWKSIHSRIPSSVYTSVIIDRYESFRDIIFGNKPSIKPEFRRFSITSSPNYQNIPRTIQNVFLNTKLDADFIKDTIINSMSDEEVFIDLQYFHGQMANFERQYNDINLWLERDKNGVSRIRQEADKVIDAYRKLQYQKQQIRETCMELNYLAHKATDDIPVLQNEIIHLEEQIRREKRLFDETEQKYKAENEKLLKGIAVFEEKLKEAKTKLEEYGKEGIEEIMARCEREPVVRKELGQKQSERDRLVQNQNDVVGKYEMLAKNKRHDFEELKLSLKNTCVEKQKETNDLKLKSAEQKDRNVADLNKRFDEERDVLQQKFDQLNDDWADCKSELQKIRFTQFFKEEMDALQNQLSELRKKHDSDVYEKQILEKDIIHLEKEGQNAIGSLENQYKTDIGALVEKKNGLQKEADELEGLIQHRKGSFVEWLDERKPGWENTIGLVADETKVLYRDDLNPTLQTETDSFYGVKINLNGIEKSVRSKEEIEAQKAQLLQQIEGLSKQINEKEAEKLKELDQVKKRFSSQIRELKDKKRIVEFDIERFKSKEKELTLQISDVEENENRKRKEKGDEYEKRLQQIAIEKEQLNVDKQKLSEKKDKESSRFSRIHSDNCKKYDGDLASFQADVERQIGDFEKELAVQLAELDRQKNHELAGKGIDTSVLMAYEGRIAELENECQYIDDHRERVFAYRKDKAELFDKVPEFSRDCNDLKSKRNRLEDKFKDSRSNHLVKENQFRNSQNEKKSAFDDLAEGLSKFNSFKQTDLCPADIDDFGEKQTQRHFAESVQTIYRVISERQKFLETFKAKVNVFKGNFSKDNTFGFSTELFTEQDYVDYACDLCEFIDNNKIEDYKNRVSEHFGYVLNRVGKEVGEITSKGSEIRKTILQINEDFRERNFTGVIKNIELRAGESSDKLMQLLLEIKKFNDENLFSMGNCINLFSVTDDKEIKAVKECSYRLLSSFCHLLADDSRRQKITLSDTFNLQFRIVENDNDSDWQEKISNIGSEGTDVLVKAMINIMLLNVFKEKISKKSGDFRLHCMMDEIGKLHPNNVKGILDFANSRNILVINSSPTTYNAHEYKYTYLLSKDDKSRTIVKRLLSSNGN